VTQLQETRRYRFGPLDRAGWILGLSATQCVLLAGGLILGGLALRATGSVLAAAAPVLVAVVASFGRWEARPLHEWIAPLASWTGLRARGLDRWGAHILDLGRTGTPELPPFLAGLRFLEVPVTTGRPRASGVGVVVDPTGQLLSATIRARGREFALLEAREQARLLDAWGAALGGFCRERGPVARITWSEWAAPASLENHLAFVYEHHRDTPAGPNLASYLDLVSSAGPLTTSHEILITLSVDRRRVHRPRAADPDQAALDTLLEELHLFSVRLEQAGVAVEPPLSPGDLAAVLRVRTDPSCAPRLEQRARTLAEDARLVAPQNCAPLSVHAHWRDVAADEAIHRVYWIAEWPRLEVPADWLATLVLHPGGIRTLSIVCEPVAPSRSRRAIDREATRLASDEDQRTRRGFRIRAQHRRAETEVLAREQELVAGYAELTYAGFFTITAFDRDTLETQAGEWQQVAGQTGLELRPLDGQHDLGLGTALPLGHIPAPRRSFLA
jgi:hypothetical protein